MSASKEKHVLFADSVVRELKRIGTSARAKASAWFFKTGRGEYGYGDAFFGVAVPEQRKMAKRYAHLPLPEIGKLLKNKVHECRLTALLILVGQYKIAEEKRKKRIVKFYLDNIEHVNSWDLVDSSAPAVLGDHLLHGDRSVLYKFAVSKNLWKRRIAIMATFAFVKNGQFKDTLRISQILLSDEHDLVHKAVGWMLREVGNRSLPTAERFLNKHVDRMPRTMLRYAIEKFPAKKRKTYLAR